jgi:Cd(II)/Pb(II)-responsive transcriptional regulator
VEAIFLMKISELSQLVDCPLQTIRYYERQGLLPHLIRSASNYRIYTNAHVARLVFIRHCRKLDMTLGEIQQLLRLRDSPEESCDRVNALLERHIAKVSQRIVELRALETQLMDLRQLCDTSESTQDCAILRELAASP